MTLTALLKIQLSGLCLSQKYTPVSHSVTLQMCSQPLRSQESLRCSDTAWTLWRGDASLQFEPVGVLSEAGSARSHTTFCFILNQTTSVLSLQFRPGQGTFPPASTSRYFWLSSGWKHARLFLSSTCRRKDWKDWFLLSDSKKNKNKKIIYG